MIESFRKRSTRLGLVAVVLLVLAACSRPAPNPDAANPTPVKEIAVNAAPVTRVDLTTNLNYTGDVKTTALLSVVPKVAGRIEKLNVDLGSSVAVGDVIAELDKELAELGVRQAEAGLVAARTRLATIQAGPRPEAVAQAEANVRAARARVAALQQAAKPEQIAQAQAQVESARQRLEGIKTPRPEVIAQADNAVAAAQARLDAAKKGATPEQVRAQEIAVEQAKNNLYSVQTQKDGVCGNTNRAWTAQCDAAQKQAFAAEEAVKIAQQQLVILKSPPTAETLTQLRAALEQATQQAVLARNPATEQDIAQAENAVRSAEAQLSLVQRPVLASDIQGAQAQVEAAEAAARLAANPYTREDTEAAQAEIARVEAQLELARTQVKELTVRSPVAGVVADRLLVVGSTASPTTPIVTVAAARSEIVLNVEEAQLGRVQVGQPAQITLPAYPGETIAGKVTLISPTVDAKSRTAVVKVEPDPAAADKLRPGMFAQVDVQSATKRNALVVPRSAVLAGTPPVVFKIEDGTVKRVEVQLGLQDRDRVEVLKGLGDGDQVVLDAINLRDGDRVAVASTR